MRTTPKDCIAQGALAGVLVQLAALDARYTRGSRRIMFRGAGKSGACQDCRIAAGRGVPSEETQPAGLAERVIGKARQSHLAAKAAGDTDTS
jgi:hypothetical protein